MCPNLCAFMNLQSQRRKHSVAAILLGLSIPIQELHHNPINKVQTHTKNALCVRPTSCQPYPSTVPSWYASGEAGLRSHPILVTPQVCTGQGQGPGGLRCPSKTEDRRIRTGPGTLGWAAAPPEGLMGRVDFLAGTGFPAFRVSAAGRPTTCRYM